MIDIFEFEDYRKYLENITKSRGMLSRLAEAAKCQPIYMSRIISGKAQLSLEQAGLIRGILQLDDVKFDYFILLVEFDRAGSSQMRAYFKSKIEAIRKDRLDMQKRFSEARTLTPEHQATYYSSSQYAAIHASLSVPELQTVQALTEGFGIGRERVIEILSFLVSVGLAVEESGRFRIGLARLHLGKNSNLIRQHHTNWRVEAIKALDRNADDLHYSAVITASEEDVRVLREHWIKALEEFNKIVAPSKEEKVQAIVLDFFSLI